MTALRLTTVVLMGLVAQGALAQTTTTLDFEGIADGASITTQYQSQGVLVSGATAVDGILNFITPHSGRNLAFAPSGLMTFSLSISNVKTVSAYVTGPANVGIFAYDASNNLVGQSISTVPTTLALLSVTSSGAPIASVQVHDGGSTFSIDDISFVTAAPVNQCRAAAEDLYNAIAALPLSAYANSKTASKDRSRLLAEVVAFEKLRASGKATQKQLLSALSLIEGDEKCSLKTAYEAPILSLLNNLKVLIKNNLCQ